MNVRGLHHVNIVVRDLDESLGFYESIGFESVARPDFGFPGAWLQMGGHQLHLIVRADATPDPAQHFALAVDDLDACVAELAALGVDVRRSNPLPGAGLQGFFRDPTGNRIELNQPPR